MTQRGHEPPKASPYGGGIGERFDPGEALRLVRRHAALLVASAAVGLTAGFAYDRAQTPRFTATARVEVAPNQSLVLKDFAVEDQGASTLRKSATARERLGSTALARRVVLDLDLDHDPRFTGRAPAEAEGIAGLIEQADERRFRSASDKVKRGLGVRQVRNTGVLAVQFSHEDPTLAARVANGAVTSYIAMEQARIDEAAASTKGFIELELADAERRLRAAEEEMIAFAERSGLSISETGVPTGDGGLASLRNALAAATAERVLAERQLEQARRNGVATLASAYTNANVQNLKSVLAKLRSEYDMKRLRMKPDFPPMQSLAARIAGVERTLAGEFENRKRAVTAQAANARRKEASLRAEIENARRELLRTQRAGIGYSALKRKVEVARTRYATLADKLSQVAIGSAAAAPPVTVVDLAAVPKAPSNRGTGVHLLAGLLCFGALGAGAAFARETLRDGFRKADDVSEALGLPVLATVPDARLASLMRRDPDEHPGVRNAYRFARNALAGVLEGEGGRVLLVTGAARRVGTTVSARRIALDLAATERRVLLIDADLAGASLTKAFDRAEAPGLADLLEWDGAVDVSTCFAPVADGAVTLLGTGRVGPATPDRLATARMGKVLSLLRNSFDVVVMDSGAAGERAEAAALAAHADATVLVLRAETTSRARTAAALERLRATGAHVAGVLLTRASADGWGSAFTAPAVATGPVTEAGEEGDHASEVSANPVDELIRSAEAQLRKRRAA